MLPKDDLFKLVAIVINKVISGESCFEELNFLETNTSCPFIYGYIAEAYLGSGENLNLEEIYQRVIEFRSEVLFPENLETLNISLIMHQYKDVATLCWTIFLGDGFYRMLADLEPYVAGDIVFSEHPSSIDRLVIRPTLDAQEQENLERQISYVKDVMGEHHLSSKMNKL